MRLVVQGVDLISINASTCAQQMVDVHQCSRKMTENEPPGLLMFMGPFFRPMQLQIATASCHAIHTKPAMRSRLHQVDVSLIPGIHRGVAKVPQTPKLMGPMTISDIFSCPLQRANNLRFPASFHYALAQSFYV